MARTRAQRRRARRRRAERAALYDPSQPLSGRTLRRASEQLTNLEFGGQQKQLGRAMQQATRQGTALANNTSDYYRQLAGDVQSSVARQSAIGAELQNRLGASANQAQQNLGQINTEAAQRGSQDAAVRGQGLSGGGQDRIAAEVAAARGLAAQSALSSQEQAASSAFNYGSLQNLTGEATGLAGGEARRDILNALSSQQADIRGKQNDLAGQVAAKRASTVLQLRQQEFENEVTSQGLGIDRAKIQADMQQARMNARLAGRRISASTRQNAARIRATERGQDITSTTHAQDRASRERIAESNRVSREKIASARKKGAKLESTDARHVKFGISNAVSDLNSVNPKNAAKWLRKQNAPGLVIRAAREISGRSDVNRKWLQPSTVRELRQLGVQIPNRWLPPSMRRGAKLGTPAIPHNKR